MNKEEYAKLCYLLGKLRYYYAESAINSEIFRKKYERISDEIADILRVIVIDEKEKD